MSNFLKYRRDIDGLRAIAVVAVVLYHFGLTCPGGFVGVDVFFVISGFLITSQLQREAKSEGTVRLADFWRRRIRRLLPAATAMSAFSLALGLWLLLPADLLEFSRSQLSQSLLVANIFFWRTTGYFASSAESKPLLHTWSLAIEEQFYLFLPLLFALLARRPKLTSLVVWIGLLTSFGLAAFFGQRSPSAAFYLLPFRAWELLLGAVLALAPPRYKELGERSALVLATFGLALTLGPIFRYNKATPFPGLSALWPCLGCLCLLHAGHRSNLISRLLSQPLLVNLGLLSYSLYLYHWPLAAFANYSYSIFQTPSLPFRLALLAASLVLATLSYFGVEKPARQSNWLYQRAFVFASVTLIANTLIWVGAQRTQGMAGRVPAKVNLYLKAAENHAFNQDLSLERAQKGQFISLGQPDKPVSFFVWGDSHAMAALPGLDRLAQELGYHGLAAVHNSRPAILGASLQARFEATRPLVLAYNQAVLTYIEQQKIPKVILISAWEDYYSRELFPGQVADTVNRLKQIGVEVWAFQEIPVHFTDVPRLMALAEIRGLNPDQQLLNREQFLKHHRLSRTHLSQVISPKQLIDPLDFLYPKGQSNIQIIGESGLYYRDSGHLSETGSLALRQLFRPFLESRAQP